VSPATESTGSFKVLGVATTSTEASESAGSSEHVRQATDTAPEKADPPPAAKLDDAQAVEQASPKQPTHPELSLTKVGHVLTKPFTAPTSSSALLLDLSVLFIVLSIAATFWLELGGVSDVTYWGRRLGDLLGRRNAG
jgi:hypothetical protein